MAPAMLLRLSPLPKRPSDEITPFIRKTATHGLRFLTNGRFRKIFFIKPTCYPLKRAKPGMHGHSVSSSATGRTRILAIDRLYSAEIQCFPGASLWARTGSRKQQGKTVRYRFAYLIPAIVLVASAVMAASGTALAEEEVQPPELGALVIGDPAGLAAATAVADCALAQTIIEGEMYLQGLLILDTCIEELRDAKLKAHYLHFRGTLLEFIRAHDRAIDDFERALDLDPENVAYAVSLGRAWLGREEYQRAQELLRSTLRLAPGNADVLSGLGTAWFKLGDTTRASAFIARALDISPDHVLALRDRGLMFLQTGALARAIEDFDHAMQKEPDRAELTLFRGIARRRLGEVKMALADFNHAAELDPNNTHVLVNRGTLFGELGRSDEAFADFTEAIDINPGTTGAWYGRGLLAARLAESDPEMLERARSDLKQAITIGPDSPHLAAAMAILVPDEPEEIKRRY